MTKFIVLLLVSVLWACTENKKPEGMINQATMANVLVDVHLLESYFSVKKMKVDSSALFLQKNYDAIYKKHKITKEGFKNSFEFYENHPEKLDKLYQIVIDELSKKDAELKGSTTDSTKLNNQEPLTKDK